ncbi:MAG TPA: multiheme c-type cytochrome [Pirellulales bacterium]|nr:multiheme c-type cytochrome [Pirellulales bacterium]
MFLHPRFVFCALPLLAISIVMPGCSPAKTAPAESEQAQSPPAAEAPAAAAPAADTPTASIPAPAPPAEEPEPAAPPADKLLAAAKPAVTEAPAAKPVTAKPTTVQPVAEEPAAGKPATEKPVADQPVTAKPTTVTPVAEKPANDSLPQLAAAPSHKPAGEKSKKPKKDPVKDNGPIFEGWAKPQATIIITGEMAGYVEPCGCAGLENQKGGLSRRDSLVKQLAAQGWPLVTTDLGGLVNRQGTQAELKFQMAVDALRAMNYSLVGLGPDDLRLGAGILLSATTEPDGKPNRFAPANVGLFELDLDSPDRFRVVESGGRKIGLVAVLSEFYQKQVASDDVKFADPVAALEKIVPKLASAADVRILLAYAPPAESVQLARRFPQFDVVVTAGGADQPPREPRRIEHGAMLIELGHKGMYAIALGLYPDAKHPIRYQRVPLDSRFPDAPEMKALMVAYQQQLRTLGWDGLGLRPTLNPRGTNADDPAGHFVGSEACGRCHKTAFDIWRNTPHAEATDTLAKLNPPRHFDPECVSCHVTGWKPQEFVPFQTGYASVETTPQLKGNGCENCHGPGGGHVSAEAGQDLSLRSKQRKVMRVVADDQSCLKCHDLDNSPEFDFSTYWPQVEHKGKD